MENKIKIKTQANIPKVAHKTGGSSKQPTNTNNSDYKRDLSQDMCLARSGPCDIEINGTKVPELVCRRNVQL